jgi:hypothetical protein
MLQILLNATGAADKENRRGGTKTRAGSVPPRATTPGSAPGKGGGAVTPAVRPASSMGRSHSVPSKRPRLAETETNVPHVARLGRSCRVPRAPARSPCPCPCARPSFPSLYPAPCPPPSPSARGARDWASAVEGTARCGGCTTPCFGLAPYAKRWLGTRHVHVEEPTGDRPQSEAGAQGKLPPTTERRLGTSTGSAWAVWRLG